MTTTLVTKAQDARRELGVIDEAIRTALSAFHPQAVNLETICFEVWTIIPGATQQEIAETLGEMQWGQTVLIIREELSYYDESGIYKTINVIAFKLNEIWESKT